MPTPGELKMSIDYAKKRYMPGSILDPNQPDYLSLRPPVAGLRDESGRPLALYRKQALQPGQSGGIDTGSGPVVGTLAPQTDNPLYPPSTIPNPAAGYERTMDMGSFDSGFTSVGGGGFAKGAKPLYNIHSNAASPQEFVGAPGTDQTAEQMPSPGYAGGYGAGAPAGGQLYGNNDANPLGDTRGMLDALTAGERADIYKRALVASTVSDKPYTPKTVEMPLADGTVQTMIAGPDGSLQPFGAPFSKGGNVTTGLVANPDPTLSGEAAMQNYTPQVQTLARQLVNAEIPYPSSFALKDPLWKTVLQATSDLDPTFNAANYKTREATRRSFTSGSDAKNINSINTLVGHLGSLQKAADELDNSSLPAYNTVSNYLSAATGDKAVTNFNMTLGAVESELASVFKGTGATDQEIKAWRERINSSQSPEQLKGVIHQAVDLMASRLEALHNKYNAGMGTVSQGIHILSPKSIGTLRTMGIDTTQLEPDNVAANNANATNGKTAPMQIGRFQVEVH